MKKILGFLFSTRLMAIAMVVFAVSIGTATFVENAYDTSTARALIYNAWWFELLLSIGILNISGTIIINKLYKKEKLLVFVLHFAFIVILIGAALTRYIGVDGSMHIREGESSNTLITDNAFLGVTSTLGNSTVRKQKLVYLSLAGSNYHKITLKNKGENVKVELLRMTPDVVDTIVSAPNGSNLLQLVIAGMSGRQTIILPSGQFKKAGNTIISFNDSINKSGIRIFSSDTGLSFIAPIDVTIMNMFTQQKEILPAGKYHPFILRSLYNFQGLQLVAKEYIKSGIVTVVPSRVKKEGEVIDALHIKLTALGVSKTILYLAERNALNNPVSIKIKDMDISLFFGPEIIEVPLSLKLNKFILEHYPGSNSPSSFESQIQLIDKNKNINEEHRIFMNNVLRYGGYRFYQSSYDSDEQGTILSVNKDYWGSIVTYAGYLLLAIGIFLGLFYKNSRFRKLSVEVTRLRSIRKSLTIVFIVCSLFALNITNSDAQSIVPDSVFINKREASKFGELLIQDPGGRIKPINSLSSEIIRKVSRSSSLYGQSADQIFLGMLVYPDFWQKMPLIKITNPDIKKLFHTFESYISFSDIFDSTKNHNYLLASYVKEAYQKKPARRSKFDTEIIRLDERINLCYMVFTGEMLRIFPKVGDPQNQWYTPVNTSGHYSGNDSLFVTNIIPLFFNTIKVSNRNKNFGPSYEALTVLHNYQYKFGGNILPSSLKVNVEIVYNNLEIFERIGGIYGLIGFILLILHFIVIFLPKWNIQSLIRIGTILIVICYISHFGGLILRWYISGHAPWSNAYEALIYIAFATMTAGLLFSKKSGITLAATAILAWLILFVAHLNWLDPEITNLVPVLKSYWLVIHVAVITASYGFLGLGALLALINLCIMIFQNGKNILSSGTIIAELTIITEMTLIIGLYMLSIGTFLGGVWANESWGRYWGWDSKETWALVSVMVYAFIAHMRLVPGLKGNFAFNLMGLLGFSSIIMTYFGVNYFLSGLHSYARGESFPIPVFVYYALTIAAVIILLAWSKQYMLKKQGIVYKEPIL